uniref:Uncharacterized protein n=1 Tax=Megaselia scalaris TaxID=36166 RepID=T1H4X8_MEGSC
MCLRSTGTDSGKRFPIIFPKTSIWYLLLNRSHYPTRCILGI